MNLIIILLICITGGGLILLCMRMAMQIKLEWIFAILTVSIVTLTVVSVIITNEIIFLSGKYFQLRDGYPKIERTTVDIINSDLRVEGGSYYCYKYTYKYKLVFGSKIKYVIKIQEEADE